ncbi:hypothetical protein B0H19DRAFT_1247263 [Mycena capillaripes]|nr:hypothetical protein B0H19DRAFT_1247263 [Mycena capillaripes]
MKGRHIIDLRCRRTRLAGLGPLLIKSTVTIRLECTLEGPMTACHIAVSYNPHNCSLAFPSFLLVADSPAAPHRARPRRSRAQNVYEVHTHPSERRLVQIARPVRELPTKAPYYLQFAAAACRRCAQVVARCTLLANDKIKLPHSASAAFTR